MRGTGRENDWQNKMKFLANGVRSWYLDLIDPAINFFIRLEIHPNHFTTVGLLIQCVSAYFIATGHFLVGGSLVWLSGTCDIIDGKIARTRGIGTKFGALYDSVLDRYAEFTMFFGLSYYFVSQEYFLTSIIAFVALGGSLMTSYVRARCEALGLFEKVGTMQRPERIVYIGGASILSGIPYISPYPIIIVLILIAVLSNYTAFQRMAIMYRATNQGRELLYPDEDE